MLRLGPTRFLAVCVVVLACAFLAPAGALASGGVATTTSLSAALQSSAAFPGVLTGGQVRYRDDGARRSIEVQATGAFAANQRLALLINGVPTYTMIASAVPGSVSFKADTNDGATVPALRAGASLQIWSDNLLFAFGYGTLS